MSIRQIIWKNEKPNCLSGTTTITIDGGNKTNRTRENSELTAYVWYRRRTWRARLSMGGGGGDCYDGADRPGEHAAAEPAFFFRPNGRIEREMGKT